MFQRSQRRDGWDIAANPALVGPETNQGSSTWKVFQAPAHRGNRYGKLRTSAMCTESLHQAYG